MFLKRRKVARSTDTFDTVEISEKNGVRSLHLGSITVQSAMRLADPTYLELSYTRSAMAFLLFHRQVRDVLLIGLGGGSIPKWLHHHCPGIRTTAVEINPQVIAVSRSMFCLPPDDDRLHVVEGNGTTYVAAQENAFDVVLIDGFGKTSAAQELTTDEFFCDCRRALRADGVFIMNLWGSDAQFAPLLDRIESIFTGFTICLPAERHGNIIVFGFRRSPGNPTWDELESRAIKLEAEYGLEFPRFVQALRKMNLCSDKRLLV